MRLAHPVLAAVLAAASATACDQPTLPAAQRSTIDCSPGPTRNGGRHPDDDAGAGWRVEGAIQRINLRDRTFEIDGVTLSVDVDTVVLIDCQRATLRELREGAGAKVVYEERAGRNAVRILEAEGEEH